MKSDIKQLENRGFVSPDVIKNTGTLPIDKIKQMLVSVVPVERTTAAKLIELTNDSSFIPYLCSALQTEKKIYCRIAICETLEKFGTAALEFLIPLIGSIGNNRHTSISLPDLNKKSFPLPRDIVCRIIIRIGPPALPYLEKTLLTGSYIQLTEIIDAIGHIAFNSGDLRSEKILLDLYYNNTDELLRWKLVRAFQSFDRPEILNILSDNQQNTNEVIRLEAERSIARIKSRNRLKNF